MEKIGKLRSKYTRLPSFGSEIYVPDRGFTHAGLFHADDVFATALLKLLNPSFTWQRGNVVPTDFDGIVYDIGGGEFDHHQADARVRENGVPYAAFGLVWEKYGSLFLNEKGFKAFDQEFVQMIDYTDNTGKRNPISTVIRNMNPEWDENGDTDSAFAEAVKYAITTLETELKHFRAKERVQGFVADKLEQVRNHTLELDRYVPWRDALLNTDVNYVIYPSARGGYNLQLVPHAADDPMEADPNAFPSEWRGKTQEELEQLTGVEGFTFCHRAGFLCAVDTLEGARMLVERLIIIRRERKK